MLKHKVINKILKVEGGYVNDPKDSGGETNFGITKAVALENGFTGKMKDMQIEFAYKVYAKKYWDSMNLDSICILSEKIAEELADTAVNLGVHRCSVFFQRCLNALNLQEKLYKDLIVDGNIGRKSVDAFDAYLKHRKNKEGEKVILSMLNCLQGEFYISLAEKREKDEKFIFGWFKNRVLN